MLERMTPKKSFWRKFGVVKALITYNFPILVALKTGEFSLVNCNVQFFYLEIFKGTFRTEKEKNYETTLICRRQNHFFWTVNQTNFAGS